MIADIETFCVPPRWIFVRVRTDDGRCGWGEAIVPKRRTAVLGAIGDLARELCGEPEQRIEELWQRARTGAFFRGGPIIATAAAAVEQALWDIKARALSVGVHELLGGRVRERIRVYSWIGGDRPGSVVADARLRVEQGFTAVKMNATAELDHLERASAVDEVVARVGALRDEFGTDLDIALDFHGRVHRSMVPTLLRELEPFRLLWVEEPVASGYESLLGEICRGRGATRIATGERLTSRWEFRELLSNGAVDILQPDVSLTGLFELEKICRIAEAFDVPVVPHCPNGPVSLAASLQVASCCVNVPLHEQSIDLHYHRGYDGLPPAGLHDYLRDPAVLTPVDGHFPVPGGAGLGIELDEDLVAERNGSWQLRDARWRLPDGRITEW